MFQLQLKLLFLALIWWSFSYDGANGDPQDGTVLNSGCSQYNASNLRSFYANINDSFSSLRTQINNQSKHFATADEARGTVIVYSMFQCRNYLSKNDCLRCFSTAATKIRNCSAANGARVIYDGCFLRYESQRFYDQTNQPGSGILCNNKTAKAATTFTTVGQKALLDLQTATPRIKGFFAATKTQVTGGGSVYATAQCVETASENDCLTCLTIGYNNLQACLPNSDGSAYDAGCFLRYSETRFFADNKTIDIAPYLKEGSSSKKWGIIGGVVGGVVLLILLALFVWRQYSKPKRTHRGNILGATELKGPVNYKYSDLKTA